jgi:pyruvate-ferredoxin/flavodoxin oxidoreductase
VPVPAAATTTRARPPVVSPAAPEFVQRVTAAIMAGHGDHLPVSAFPVDGTWPVGTARWEKRNLATAIPVWDPAICIQCNKCALLCPHAAIRAKVVQESALAGAPDSFRTVEYRGTEHRGERYVLQVAPEDCTGCSLCVEVCPAKDKSNPRHKAIEMQPQPPLRARERANWELFLGLPEAPRATIHLDVKGSQLLEPLFESSGACAGCGETPYIKLVTQLFGDRALIANATGCSSIYGGNLPTTPYSANRDGRGPAWSNSLFEDNAEFGLGMRLAVDASANQARALLVRLAPSLPAALVESLARPVARDEGALAARRAELVELRRALAVVDAPDARRLELVCDSLAPRSVWIVGGDGWAYDIGFGGLDHVLASGQDVNLLVLDTEVYSNTGGQQSKATPKGAAAKFAVAGKATAKKDLGLMAMSYGNVYVASVAMGATDAQTVKALVEADSYPGPSLVIAYSHCIAHGYDLAHGAEHQKLAVEAGYWPLYRFDPRRAAAGEPALKLDSGPPGQLAPFLRNETRFRMVEEERPERFRALVAEAESDAARRFAVYQRLAGGK